jgi:hypothetical protein
LGTLAAVVAAIVDSRNIFHQAGDATGIRARPTVPGVRAALAHYGFEVSDIHVGLALARPGDLKELARYHADNDAYRGQIRAAGGDVLLGELHRKPSGAVEEKMVDCACCVRITRYVDEITGKRTAIEAIMVLSKDIDLRPAVDYAIEMSVPIIVGAHDVVQHRGHPYLLLGPHAYAQLTESPGLVSGHELRELLVCALYDGAPVQWTVKGSSRQPTLAHSSGLVAVPASGVSLPPAGQTISLCPVDVTWEDRILGSFPVLVCETMRSNSPCWLAATVRRRTAPMTLEVEYPGGIRRRVPFPLGGVVPDETVLVHRATGRVLGRLCSNRARRFDPDVPQVLRIVSRPPMGGAIAVDTSGTRGLLTTDQVLRAGERVPAVQIDLKPRGPVWAAIGTPLPG